MYSQSNFGSCPAYNKIKFIYHPLAAEVAEVGEEKVRQAQKRIVVFLVDIAVKRASEKAGGSFILIPKEAEMALLNIFNRVCCLLK
jgi:hypothetical protein